MPTEEEKQLAQLLGNVPKRSSLMNLPAGGRYFSGQTNIPPMVGNFYVGSPTEVISDYVPLPLDFIQEDLNARQHQFDTVRADVNTFESSIREALKATEYNEDYKEELLKKYGIADASQNWAKQLLANPLTAGQVAQDLMSLKAKFNSDEGVQRVREEYEAWNKEKDRHNIIESGWANFIDPRTNRFKQLDPTKTKGQWTADDHMNYWKTNYERQLSQSIKEELEKNNYETKLNEFGLVEYRKPGTTTWEAIDPYDKKNPSYNYVTNAVTGLARQLMNDPNLQVRGILAERMGFGDNPAAYLQFVNDMLANQYYSKKTINPSELQMTSPGKDYTGGGGGDGIIMPTQDLLQVYSGSANIVSNGGNPEDKIQELTTNVNKIENSVRQKVLDTFTENLATDQLEYLENVLLNGTNGNNGLNQLFDKLAEKHPDNPLLQNKDWVEIVTQINSKSNNQLKKEWGADIYNQVNNVITQGLLEAMSRGDNDNQILLDDLANDLATLDKSRNELEYLKLYKDQAVKQALSELGLSEKAINMDDMSLIERAIKDNPLKLNDFTSNSALYNMYVMASKGKNFYKADKSFEIPEYTDAIRSNIKSKEDYEKFLLKTRPDLYKALEEGYVKINYLNSSGAYNLKLSPEILKKVELYNKVEKTAAWQNYIKGNMATNSSVVTYHDTTAGRETKTAKVENDLFRLYSKKPDLALAHMQLDAKGDGKDNKNKPTLLDVLKGVNENFTDTDELKVSGVNIIDIPNYGLPRIQVTYMNKSGQVASVDFQLPKNDDNHDMLKITAELMAETDPNERELGYQWYANMSIKDHDKFKINTFFNPDFKPSDEINVPIKAGPHTYYLHSNGKGDKQLRYLNPNTGEYEPLVNYGEDAKGKSITNKNIKNSLEATKLIGLHLYKNAQAMMQGGGTSGGSAIMGKSPIAKDQLWRPQ